MMEDVAQQSEYDVQEKTNDILSRNPDFTLEMIQQFIREHSSDPTVKGYSTNIQKLKDDVFKRLLITDLCYQKELPPKMTKEMYIQIYRKIFLK